ncbi:hypothetical protein M2346_003095 [Sphingobium xanthum]|nr:hypothetical protein [Sphingobium sp. B10D3B]MCW2403075.1 hypothetical protein [Sphingobium sp. B10D7B]MCW2410054.1 hypothetical protein [Sphingobium xanthum]
MHHRYGPDCKNETHPLPPKLRDRYPAFRIRCFV